jgi:cytochrome c oxidase assembly factor CtaG
MSWVPDPVVAVPLLAVGLAYTVGLRRLGARHARSRTATRRAAAFWCGYGVLLVALLSPLHALGEEIFSVHMVQHLLLTMVAAPLLLLSNAVAVMLWAFPPDSRERAGLVSMVSPRGSLMRLVHLLTRPLVAWIAFVACQWLWHQPGPYQLAATQQVAHYAEHLTFFGTALLFWWPVVGTAPLGTPLTYPARMLYTFLAWLPNSVLGAGFTFSTTVQYPHYAERAAALGIDAQADQTLAGLIMWVPGDLLFLAILLVLLAAYLNDEERRATRLERQQDALEATAQPFGPVSGGREET